MKTNKVEKGYFFLKNWWETTELTNYEKNILNKNIIYFNQQLLRLKDKTLRIGVYGKSGVGKSSILNSILKKDFFKTGVLNGSTDNIKSKEISFKNNRIKKVELIDFPGFDICKKKYEKLIYEYINNLDMIFFVVAGDLNRNELANLNSLINKGKKIILILNKIDIWNESEINIILKNITNKLPFKNNIEIIKNSNKLINKMSPCFKSLLSEIGESILILNSFDLAYKLSIKIKELRLSKRKKEAQSIIGKFATLKASGVALNPLIFIDIAGSHVLDRALIKELSKVYGLEIQENSAKNLIKRISIDNIYLGATQIGINATFNLIKKISLISAPLSTGITLLPYGSVAIAQAALAIKTTKLIGRLAAKEILYRSKVNNLEPFQIIQQLAIMEPELINSINYCSFKQNPVKDYSTFLP